MPELSSSFWSALTSDTLYCTTVLSLPTTNATPVGTCSFWLIVTCAMSPFSMRLSNCAREIDDVSVVLSNRPEINHAAAKSAMKITRLLNGFCLWFKLFISLIQS